MTNSKLFAVGLGVLVATVMVVIFSPANAGAVNYCTPNYSKQCVSNIVYWYDSCGALQDVAQNCNNTNQICQNGQCVDKPPVYVKHASKQCYQGDIYWYDSKGAVQEVQKSCADTNSCTLDSCAGATCSNTLKCDGSTCATGSVDYVTYCGGTTPTPNPNQTTNFVTSLSVKKEADTQWQETITASPGQQLQFSLSIANNNAQPAHGSSIRVDIANAIEYTGNLQINGVISAGSILTGIDLGTIGAGESKNISFTGVVILPVDNSAQITATATSGNLSSSDNVTLSSAAPTEPETTTSNSAIVNFFKQWYLWIIIVAILAVLFVIIFRRLGKDG